MYTQIRVSYLLEFCARGLICDICMGQQTYWQHHIMLCVWEKRREIKMIEFLITSGWGRPNLDSDPQQRNQRRELPNMIYCIVLYRIALHACMPEESTSWRLYAIEDFFRVKDKLEMNTLHRRRFFRVEDKSKSKALQTWRLLRVECSSELKAHQSWMFLRVEHKSESNAP